MHRFLSFSVPMKPARALIDGPLPVFTPAVVQNILDIILI